MSVIKSLHVTIIENQEGFFFAFLGGDHPFEEVHQNPKTEEPFKTAAEARAYIEKEDASWGLETGVGHIRGFGEYNIVDEFDRHNVYVADGRGDAEEWTPRD